MRVNMETEEGEPNGGIVIILTLAAICVAELALAVYGGACLWHGCSRAFF